MSRQSRGETSVIQSLIVGASIFVLLGSAHGALTLRDLSHPRAFTPKAELRAAMQQSAIALNPSINLWRAWLGFNLTHSLGAVMFGSAFLYLGILHSSLFSQSPLLQCLAVLLSAIYLVISSKFFFSKPVIGSAVSMVCFVLATLMSYA
jgi:hypothetical protein